MLKKETLLLSIALEVLSVLAYAQKEKITDDQIWTQYKFYAKGIDELRSTSDGEHYTVLKDTNSMQYIISYNYSNGLAADTLLSSGDLKRAGNDFRIESYELCSGERNILLSTASEHIYRHSTVARYFIWNRTARTLTDLTDGKEKVMYPTLSPDGNKAAYIFKSNIYIRNIADGATKQITTDGTDDIFNGVSDWVYEEEFTVTRAYFWSPDSKSVAYYRFDDTKVPVFSMNEYKDSLYPTVYSFRYPKAGEPNPEISIHIYNLEDGVTTNIIPPHHFEYVPRIKWTQDPRTLSIQYMNRHQDTLVLALADAKTGKTTPILTEGEKGYIDINDALTFINNNREFIWQSDADGYTHLYRYSIGGKLINRITAGKWDVLNFKGTDAKNQTIYFISDETSPIDKDIYSVKWDGKNKRKLSDKTGTNDIEFSADYKYSISYYSNVNDPEIITLRNSNGKTLRVLEDNHALKDTLKNYRLGKKSFFRFTTSQGTGLNGWMLTPPGFDSTKKYPVLMYVYGGPGSNTVDNSYGGTMDMWFQMMAERGYIVASVDNRGTGGRGADFQKCTYMHLGELETQDQIETAKYFASKLYVAKDRIGIWGWSYGGYMAAMCITKGADYFKTAISVAPVTDWDYYDSIYTERYMRTPTENRDGYTKSSPIHYANLLKGHYLLIHGTADDNVHFQNSIEWIKALQKDNKPFSLMIYPDKNHSIYGGNTRCYLFNELTDYLNTNL